MKRAIQSYLGSDTEAAPLAVFRIGFGLVMVWSMIRFWANGWIEKLYLEPSFHFSYHGFSWVKPIGDYTYGLFIICGLSALMVALGYKYRLAIITFFLSFTYIELMDKTTYLNHYYFISLVSFIMIFLPAHAYYSIDARRNSALRSQRIPKWSVHAIKLMLTIVYLYAGLAKLNSDWLIHAIPLKIWLPTKDHIPILGELFQYEWIIYVFSWFGMIYDLSIPFVMMNKKTRPYGFFFVVVFHVLTRVLFNIGMFPYIMIFASLIFFDSQLHHRILAWISKVLRISKDIFDNNKSYLIRPIPKRLAVGLLGAFFTFQLLLPFRYLMYPGELFWTEEGYRFSWRVMLMEKAGYTQFKVVDPDQGTSYFLRNGKFLSTFQEKQMSFQPDFILEYAHYLAKYCKEEQGIQNPEIYADSYVALNGRLSRRYIDPNIDLAKVKPSFRHKSWILPIDYEIKGL
ncbi:MAG: HTTM domain-containing protein [Bacteroidota bacterium]